MSSPSTLPFTPATATTSSAQPASSSKLPSASLYVGDLAPEVTEGLLFETFNNVGPVSSIRVCRDTLTRRSLGYAYVNFHSVVDAERALDTLNNHTIAGRPCRIMWSQRDPSIRRAGVGNIFIKNLDPSIGHKELYDTFSAFGNILSCKVAMDEKGNSKGYGFVHYENQQCADDAVQTVNNNIMLDKKVYVGPFIARKTRTEQLEKSWTNVFVKDIDLEISDAEFLKAFGEFGPITSGVIMRKEDGTSRGFGFINFAEHESATKAVEAMHGTKLGNKALYCCRAQKRAEREAKLRKEWEKIKVSKYHGINLYIKNIEDEIDEERLRTEFSAWGTIKSCKIMTDEKGTSKGFGFVCYSAPEESQRAINEMNNRTLPGCQKPLYVALHEPKEVRRQKLTLTAIKGMRGNVSPGAPGALYGAGQPVYYPSNLQQGFVYPQQMMSSMPRGWQTQFPMHATTSYPANVGALPRGGATSASRGRTAPRGGNTTGAGGRGQAARRSQVPTTESVVPVDGLTLAYVRQFPPEQQKLLLGERLYGLIAVLQPTLAGKITGMFLESGWPVEELFALLGDEATLRQKIEDAMSVLAANQSEEGEATA